MDDLKEKRERYVNKKAARVERLRARAENKRAFANDNDLSLYGETKSGIPLGQPILVGHHSERRHRKHLERIENKVRKGFEAANEADRLEQAADAVESRTAIDSDNPDALQLIDDKIARLEKTKAAMLFINKTIRSLKNFDGDKVLKLSELIEASEFKPEKYSSLVWAKQVYTPDCFGIVGFASFSLTNLGAEIRRLKKRREGLVKVQNGFESFTVNGILVELVDGQVQVDFGFKPDDATRDKLKRSPLALKWSSYSKRWVRKHTETTAGRWFKDSLREVLESVVR